MQFKLDPEIPVTTRRRDFFYIALMPARILLQPGQIWSPASPAFPSRHILDLPEGMIAYAQRSTTDTEDAEDTYIVTQSLFRRWIKKTNAAVSKTEKTKYSPTIELSKKIVTLRKACGMSQKDLAQALDLSRSAIASMETGRTSKINKHLPKLAAIFQVPITLFLNGMADQPIELTLSSDEMTLIDLYRSLTPERKITVQKYTERQSQK